MIHDTLTTDGRGAHATDPPSAGARPHSRGLLRRPWAVVAVSLAILVGSVAYGSGVSGALVGGGMVDPQAPSTTANYLLETEFPLSRPNIVVTVTSTSPADDPTVQQVGTALTEELAELEGLYAVQSWWTTGDDRLISEDGRTVLVTAASQVDPVVIAELVAQLREQAQEELPGVEIAVGGPAAVTVAISEQTDSDLLRAELIAIPLTFLVLVFVLGSAVSALLPVAIGVFSIVTTTAVLRLITLATPVSTFSLNVCTALGLGLAIDYGLLVVRRYREELARTPGDYQAAVIATVRTAGRTVAFSCATVALSLSALLVFPQYFLRSFAYAGTAVVLLTGLAAVVLLPALLLLLGPRIDRWTVRRRRGDTSSPGWRRIGEAVVRRPLPFATLTALVLVVLGSPFLRFEAGLPDDRQLPAEAESSRVAETLRTEFPGSTERHEIVLRGANGAREEALASYAAEVSQVSGVVAVDAAMGRYVGGEQVEGPRPESEAVFDAGGTTWLLAIGDADPNSVTAKDTVAGLRDLPAPAGAEALVGGPAAQLVDTEAAVAEGLPWALLIVGVTSAALLLVLTGGVLVTVKALVLNTASLLASFGAIVWIFQEGHLQWLLGDFQVTGNVDINVLVLVFCVAFGLSMDYEVFLLSRIREEYRRSGSTRHAIVDGLEHTGGVVTTAALLICIVLVGLATSSVVGLKIVGVALALAILVDATLVRCLLAPAVMRLAGRANWWAPAPLARLADRLTPHD